ncbi:YceI family protein [Streptomyces sp. NPDC054884]|uniref:YceI family protein n=1 Tax=Streptomyces sp. ME08-AFT2 TaxID=3028683 RepID=UPI0029ABF1A9|nr:YceI family protein [Streptomyces sp. ME08-AFT2]MDX3311559.1 YceI family protein [Streptomyces sp. ME08-AFT2]
MTVAVETGLWQLDADASTVALKHRTMWGLVTVKGVFTAVDGGGEVAADGTATGVLTLRAASLDTKNAKRDAHLRGADFFDADHHPEITFAVRSARLGAAEGAVEVSGQLTVRGVSRPQSLTARLSGADSDAITLETEFAVDRGEFGLGWNQLGMIRGTAAVTATLRFTRKPA